MTKGGDAPEPIVCPVIGSHTARYYRVHPTRSVQLQINSQNLRELENRILSTKKTTLIEQFSREGGSQLRIGSKGQLHKSSSCAEWGTSLEWRRAGGCCALRVGERAATDVAFLTVRPPCPPARRNERTRPTVYRDRKCLATGAS